MVIVEERRSYERAKSKYEEEGFCFSSRIFDEKSIARAMRHQDRNYCDAWEEESELFTAWVALTDIQDDCGPMVYVRSSHK